jgi:hydroxymethylbilane synthase
MLKILRIGTRDSKLALWQAVQVRDLLAASGIEAELVPVRSEGDIDLKTPLYAMGVQGIFTRSLDAALLNNRVDIAVHSMKDVPISLPEGICQAAVLPRGPVSDLLLYRGDADEIKTRLGYVHGQWISLDENPVAPASAPFLVATSSLRRRAQWLNRYPAHRSTDLRGNVQTRLKKLDASDWNGAIFARAGLDRIGLLPAHALELDWMLPAPAQGAIMVVCREEDTQARECLAVLNDAQTELCTRVERDFLKTLMGGCTTPVGAHAEIKDGRLHFNGNLLSVDGRLKVSASWEGALSAAGNCGISAAKRILEDGGREILEGLEHA